MKTRTLHLLVIALAIRSTVAGAAPDDAYNAEWCTRSYGDGVASRDRGMLVEARDAFMLCERAACPSHVRQRCMELAAESEAQCASIVLDAVTSDGNSATGVTATAGNQRSIEMGRTVLLNPGRHEVVFEWGFPRRTVVVQLRAGEKNRRVLAEFHPDDARDLAEEESKLQLAFLIAGGVAPWALVIGTGTAIAGRVHEFRRDACADAACRKRHADEAKTDYVTAGVSLGIGVVATAVAVGLALKQSNLRAMRYSSRAKRAETGWFWSVDVSQSLWGASGRFVF